MGRPARHQAPHRRRPVVTVHAPERHEGEFWTFAQQRDGVLTCFTDLLGSPSLLTPTVARLTVLVPADRMDDVKVTFAETTPEEH